MNDGDGVLLGFDFGLKRIGVAVGQRLTGGARPLATLRAQDGEPDWERLGALLDEWRPRALVVGLPYNVDGSAHALTAAAGRFADALQGRFDLDVHRVDERYTSLEAARTLTGQRQRGERGRLRDGEVDAAAAAVILQAWLDGEQAT